MKKYLMRTAVLLAGFILASCSQDFMTQTAEKVEEFNTNFQNLVMGDLPINPDQTWSTSSSTTIDVSVDMDYGAEYRVFIYKTAPLVNPNAKWIGMATLKSGETKSITFARPSNTVMLYAALYDSDNHAIYKPFVIEKSTNVTFSNKTASSARTRGVTQGNRWSVTKLNMPDLTAYTTGELLEMREVYNTNEPEGLQPDDSEIHLKITGNYSGSILRLQSYANQSVYVTGTWTVPEDQRVTGESVVIVGNGGKIIVPEGHMLSTNANNEAGTTGMIYVLPGGTIEGAGDLQFSNGTQTYSYNAGTITVANVNINGGTLYNAGTIGTANQSSWRTCSSTTALTGPGGTEDRPSKFINLGTAVFTQIDGAGIGVDNACNLRVTGMFALGKTSKMDDGSYTECGSMELNGSNNGNIYLYMGNSSFLKCLGNFAVLNFGVWGPNGVNSGTTKALFYINGCANTDELERAGCNYTAGIPSTYMLDNVELILGPDYPDYSQALSDNATLAAAGVTWALNAQHDYYRAALLVYGWFNGSNCQQILATNYDWAWDTGYTWKEGTAKYDVDESRATCILESSPSYPVISDDENCGITIDKGSDPDPVTTTPSEQTITDDTPEDNPDDDTTPEDNPDDDTTPPTETTVVEVPTNSDWVYYAFEDLGGTRDFDFNDEVIRVSTPVNGRSVVQILAVGAELNAYILYQGSRLGAEVHAAIGAKDHVITNTKMPSVVPNMFRVLGEISVPAGTSIGNLDFGLEVLNNDGSTRSVIASRVNGNNSTSKSAYGSAPLYLVINGDEDGKWYWPREMVNITNAFSNFSTWGSTLSEGTDWYMPKNANTYNVVTW